MSRDFFKQRETTLISQQEKTLEAFVISGGTSAERKARVNSLRVKHRDSGFPHEFVTSFGSEFEDAPDIVLLMFSNKQLDESECAEEFVRSLAVRQSNNHNLSNETRFFTAFAITGGTRSERIIKFTDLQSECRKQGFYFAVTAGDFMQDETALLLASNKEFRDGINYDESLIRSMAVDQGNVIDLTPTSSLQCGK